METTDDLARWHEELSALWRRVAPWCYRAEPRERLWRYLVGLLSETARKNGWHLAETMHETRPDGMQRLLNSACWNVEAVRDELRMYVVEHLGDPAGVLIADETGFLKQGRQSAGVARQYSGTAGRIENQPIGVFLAYASMHGYAFSDRELYLPEVWTSEPARCAAAGIPAIVSFATKTELVQQMVARALAAAVPVRWFVGDAIYSADTLRVWLEARGMWYVVAIACTTSVWTHGRQVEVATLFARQPAAAWMRLSAGSGSQGERWYDWTWVRLPTVAEPGMAHWMMARRSVSDPSEFAYYHAAAPGATPLAVLAHVAGTRWVIEVGFAQAKEELGLDQYEVRQWGAWYRHVTLVLLAYAYLVMLRRQSLPADAEHGLIPWTVPEVRRVAQALAASVEERQHRLSWSYWRRRHQAVAQQCHRRRRQSRGPDTLPISMPAPQLPGIGSLTDRRWQQIQAILPARASAKGRPSSDPRRLLDAMLTIMHQGVSWHEIPADIAPWQTVYTRFQQWAKAGIWDQIVLILSP